MIWTFLIVCTGFVSAHENVHPRRLSELINAGEYEEFARLLQIDEVELVRRNNNEQTEFIDMLAKPVSPVGDNLLTKKQSEEARMHIDFFKHPERMWANCTAYIWIQQDVFAWREVHTIKSAYEEFNRLVSHFKILPYPEVIFNTNVIYVTNSSGCWTYMAMARHGTFHPIFLHPDCLSKGNIMRLFMFAVGFYYEHNRFDRDRYIEMLWVNIPEHMYPFYEKYEGDDYVVKPFYDYYSITHAPIKVPGTDKDAFRVLRGDGINTDLIGKGESLSPLDVRKINDAYRYCDRM